MDAKTKSIIIGLVSAFAAVVIIIMLFFTISGMNGSDGEKAKSDSKGYTEVMSVDSEGNPVVIIEYDDDDDDNDVASGKSADVSSDEVQNTGFFGRSDIDGITKGISTFAQFVKAVDPASYEWNTDSMGATGEAEVKLIASDGSYAVIGVPYNSSDYKINGETSGSGSDVTKWEIYDKCKKKECRAKEIVWLSNKMKFSLPRGVVIGSDYPDVSAAYYKDPEPAKTYIFYEMKDVLTDEAKIKKYNKAEEAYIGGKLYKTTTMIEYNYKENPDAYPFANNSKNIIRYGFNSIVDTEETAGQWYIDYAIANSKVVGVYFHMRGADD